MKIVADENIPLLTAFFGEMGDLVPLPGRSMTAADIADADVLLVRSVTKVNRELLSGSNVRFVATATSGTDHVDTDWLKQQVIGFSAAPGCNARSVTEYVLSSLDILQQQLQFRLENKTVGIIGKGEVGSRLLETLTRLGVECLVCDPFVQAQAEDEDDVNWCSLDELLQRSDIISLHVPLTTEGDYPTRHMINAARLEMLKPDTILINTARGPVVDNRALKACLLKRTDLTAVLDVWEDEPVVDPELLQMVAIGTPHIAGYSLDGKLAGTEAIYQAVCRHFGLPLRVKLGNVRPIPELSTIGFSCNATAEKAASTAIRAVYDVRRDDMALRRGIRLGREEQAIYFDQLRREYPERREFGTLKVNSNRCQNDVVGRLKALGFAMK
ncbi:4-phosphoerythronate dehydrogenase PdxB [Spongorhabdus nitratireducens]